MASKKITLTEAELDALIERKIAKLAEAADSATDGDGSPLDYCRHDHSEKSPVVRAFIALATAVGVPCSPDGHTPFESALAEMVNDVSEEDVTDTVTSDTEEE